jgi:DNA-binding transcriptional LysR family regulator
MNIFLKVHQFGSIRMAAEACNLTPSAVAKAIHRFEIDRNCKLFHTRGNSVLLTPLGHALLPFAERLIKSELALNDCLDRHTGQDTDVVTIHCSESFGAYYLPSALVLFAKQHPEIRIECTLSHNNDSLRSTLEMRNDISVVSNMEKHADIDMIPLFTDRLVFIVPNTEEFAKITTDELWRLHGKHAIVHEKDSFPRRAFEQFVRDARIQCPIRMELSNNEQIRQSVLAGLGIALVSSAVVQEDVKAGRIRMIDPQKSMMERTYVIAMHRTRFHSKSVHQFVDTLVDWSRSFAP